MPVSQLSVYFFLQAAVILLMPARRQLVRQRVGQPPQVVGEMDRRRGARPSPSGCSHPNCSRRSSGSRRWACLRLRPAGGHVHVPGGHRVQRRPLPGAARSAVSVSVAASRCLSCWPSGWSSGCIRCWTLSDKRQSARGSVLPRRGHRHHRVPDAGTTSTNAHSPAPRWGRWRSRRAVDDVAAWCILAVVLASFGGMDWRLARHRRRHRLCAVHAAGRPPTARLAGHVTGEPLSPHPAGDRARPVLPERVTMDATGIHAVRPAASSSALACRAASSP